MDTQKRWTLTVIYRGQVGAVEVEHEISEISDAAAIIARGPDSSAILWISMEPILPQDNATTLQSPLQRCSGESE